MPSNFCSPSPVQVYVQSPREYILRARIAALIQDVLLVLRSSHCLQPCAHWYTSELQGLVDAGACDARLKLFRMPAEAEEGAQSPPSLATWTRSRLSFQEMAPDGWSQES